MTGLWHVCCRQCRRAGHRPGCTRCEDRTQATFALPHPDDTPGRGDGYQPPEYPDWPSDVPRPSQFRQQHTERTAHP